MFYCAIAYNSESLYAWSSNPGNVDRWVEWLNRNRDINVYAAYEVPEDEWDDLEGRDDVLSMDESYWDEFMIDA